MAQMVLGRPMVCLQVPSAGDHILTKQSSPPEAISPVTNVVTAKTKPMCPLKVCSKFPSVDHSFTVSSFEHEANPYPGTSLKALMISSWAFGISFCCWPLYQSLILLSCEPVITIPFGRLRTDTACWCPSRVAVHLPVLVSQILAVPSHDPLTISSGTD